MEPRPQAAALLALSWPPIFLCVSGRLPCLFFAVSLVACARSRVTRREFAFQPDLQSVGGLTSFCGTFAHQNSFLAAAGFLPHGYFWMPRTSSSLVLIRRFTGRSFIFAVEPALYFRQV